MRPSSRPSPLRKPNDPPPRPPEGTMSANLVQLVENFGRPHVVVLGDLILDRYVWVGADKDADASRALLDGFKIDHSMVFADLARPTTVKERYIGRAQQKHPQQM